MPAFGATWPGLQLVQVSLAPVEKELVSHWSCPVAASLALALWPASTVEQYAAPPSENFPLEHFSQPSSELAPLSENFPAAHSAHDTKPPLLDWYFPGAHCSHFDDPALLKPLPQLVQVSLAPVEKVSASHCIWPVAASLVLALYPASTVEQKADPASENFPLGQGEHT